MVRQRVTTLLLFTILALIATVGCAPAGAPKAGATTQLQASGAVTVTDDAGRTVRLERPAAKIVSLSPSNTEILYAVGAGSAVVGVDDYSDYPPEAKGNEKVGGYSKINIEKVVSLGPDLVLATNIHEKTIVPELERRDLAVVIVHPKNVAATLDSIKLVGKLTGKQREADDLAQSLRGRLDAVAEKMKGVKSRPRVYFELDPKLFTVGPGSFVDDMITIAGGNNVAADASTQWPQFSDEALLLKDPEVILLGDGFIGETADKVKARPGWQVISAVKNGRVHAMTPELTNRPGPRVLEGIEEMARAIQPELFK